MSARSKTLTFNLQPCKDEFLVRSLSVLGTTRGAPDRGGRRTGRSVPVGPKEDSDLLQSEGCLGAHEWGGGTT